MQLLRLVLISVGIFLSMVLGLAVFLVCSIALKIPGLIGGGAGVALTLLGGALVHRLDGKYFPERRPGDVPLNDVDRAMRASVDAEAENALATGADAGTDAAPAEEATDAPRPPPSLAEQIRHELQLDRPQPGPGWLASLVLGAIFLKLAGVNSVREAIVLLGVLFAHELGHMVAMQLVGYRDVRIFFVPLFGAVTTARSAGTAVAPWKRVMVSLAGPVPGIFFVGVMTIFDPPEGALREAAWLALLLNAFNLLPLTPLDGGRIIGELVASRAWALEVLFVVVSGLALVALGWSISWPMLAILGAVQIAQLPRRKQQRELVATIRTRWAAQAPSPQELPEAELAAFASMVHPFLSASQQQPARYASQIRGFWEQATQSQASLGATVGLLSLYGASCLGALVALVLWSLRSSP